MENEPLVVESKQVSGPTLGFWGKLAGIFTSPNRTFQELDKRPAWITPFLIMLVIAVLSVSLLMPLIMQNTIKEMSKNQEVTQQQIEMMARVLPISTVGSAILMIPVWLFALSGILYLVGSVILGGDTTFKKLLAINSWSMLIMGLSSIVTVPLALVRQNMFISLSLSLILPTESIGSRLFVLLSQFNFFTIWYLIVLAIGFGTVYKFTTGKAITAMAVLWVIWVAFVVAIGGFGGAGA